jgi:hypothetical protein
MAAVQLEVPGASAAACLASILLMCSANNLLKRGPYLTEMVSIDKFRLGLDMFLNTSK